MLLKRREFADHDCLKAMMKMMMSLKVENTKLSDKVSAYGSANKDLNQKVATLNLRVKSLEMDQIGNQEKIIAT